MPRFQVGETVEWVSPITKMRRVGHVAGELPDGQYAVRPVGLTVEHAVDTNDLTRAGGDRDRETFAPPSAAPSPPPAKPSPDPEVVREQKAKAGRASAAKLTPEERRERASRAAVARQEKRRQEEAAAPLPAPDGESDGEAEGEAGAPTANLAAEWGRKGGRAAWAKLTPAERREKSRRMLAAKRARRAATEAAVVPVEPPPAAPAAPAPTPPPPSRGTVAEVSRFLPMEEEPVAEEPTEPAPATDPRPDGLDAGEGAVMDLLAAARVAYAALPLGCHTEVRDFVDGLNRLERILATRAMRQRFPEGWR